MGTRAVTVLRAGWWLPGRVLAAGDTLTLDAATAEALARRGIVRLEPLPDVASIADRAAATPPKTRRKAAAKEA
ncbi:hypothetical protein EDC62_0235 [Tibeticola sediminis]|uniref:Uncharacterized protein n=1 Tax=Tibeticola sediminis TaxID=1917811 RepID=A0A3N4VHX9_9BURK|nr:hypothetical protein [Tibeticola sediminis]RPE72544.1 hypothetical protein EDC62_0235 [Tibeticola sediminis]